MITLQQIKNDLHKINKKIQHLTKEKQELENSLERKIKRKSSLNECFIEAEEITKNIGTWNMQEYLPYKDMPLSILFLGACSGEWSARSHYIGNLPGFGGFLLVAGDRSILVDPGRTTMDNLLASGIHPKKIDNIIVTHSHWDCTRDLLLVIMAASGSPLEMDLKKNKRLELIAAESVIYGRSMSDDVLQNYPGSFPDYFKDENEDEKGIKNNSKKFLNAQPATLNLYDLNFRLAGKYKTLEIGKRYDISPDICIYTRRSYHPETYDIKEVPALDIIIKKDKDVLARCVYLTDTEYRKDLAESYVRDLEELGPIDILICNVKTLNVFPYKNGPLKDFTKKHLGWRGLVQLTKDLKTLKVLKPSSMVVLRAWGIETVTKLDEDGTMIATPEKLEIYERSYMDETDQKMALIPYRTWVGVSRDDQKGILFQHQKRPFQSTETTKLKKFGSISYRSKVMDDIVLNARRLLANREVSVLITGETGTGKDELAKSIHTEACLKGFRDNIIVLKNATDLTSGLSLDQMIGHTKGAFTGAISDSKGWFEEAQGGTLVIDEIADMGLDHQSKLLTILPERKFQRIGDTKEIPLDAQIIFTTNKDINNFIQEGRFREDLKYRINRSIYIPPLRERKEDIEALLYGWYDISKCPEDLLKEDIIRILEKYEWPGNVRSLENFVDTIKESGDFSINNIKEKAGQENQMSSINRDKPEYEIYLDPIEKEILSIFNLNKGSSYQRFQLQDMISQSRENVSAKNLSKSTLVKKLNRLINKGIIKKRGDGPNTYYQA